MIQARKGGGGLGDSIRRSASESSVVDDMDWAPLEEKATAIQALVTEAERETRRTQKNYEMLGVEVKALGVDYKEVSFEGNEIWCSKLMCFSSFRNVLRWELRRSNSQTQRCSPK